MIKKAGDVLYRLILQRLASIVGILFVVTIGTFYIRRLRNAILEVSRQPFVQGARALGLPEWMVYIRYIFPHVGLMLLPMMGVTMGAMLGGSAVIETVFSIKGIGYMMVQGIMARDYVLMQGYIIWITMVFIVINIIIDVLSVWLNPKRRAAIKGGSYE